MMSNGMKSRFNKVLLKMRSQQCVFREGVVVNSFTELEGHNVIGPHSDISGAFIGMGTYTGSSCSLSHSRIGRFCSIGNRVNLALGNHPTARFASTHPAFFSPRRQAGFAFVSEEKYKELSPIDEDGHYVTVGNDVWIGDNALILSGVSIGDGSIIGAGAVVVDDVMPYSIVGGVPARIIRMRFSGTIIDRLEKTAWWEKGFAWVSEHANLFEDVENLLSICEREENENI